MNPRLELARAQTRRQFLKNTGIGVIATVVANVLLNLDAVMMKG